MNKSQQFWSTHQELCKEMVEKGVDYEYIIFYNKCIRTLRKCEEISAWSDMTEIKELLEALGV